MIYATIGAQLKALRKKRGLTMAQLAAMVETSPQAVQQIEVGKTATPLPKLERLAVSLGARLVVAVVADDDLDAQLLARISAVLPRLPLTAKLAFSAGLGVYEEGQK